jgi:hypothetical protein
MAEQKAKAKGRKIGRHAKKPTNAHNKDRHNRCTDNKAAAILRIVLNGNTRTFGNRKPHLRDNRDGTFDIVGYPGYQFVKHNKTLKRT